MKLVSVCCNHCGAPLEVPAKTRFLTCTYCSARLEVQRSGGAAYTEVLESIDERTQQIADDVRALKVQQELESLDRDWETERAGLLVRDKKGRLHVPTTTGSLLGAGIMGGFGTLWTVMAVAITRNAPMPLVGVIFPLFGVLFVVAAVAMGITGAQKAARFEEAQRRHQARRRKKLAELGEVDAPDR
jgi:hypothetical protein